MLYLGPDVHSKWMVVRGSAEPPACAIVVTILPEHLKIVASGCT